MFSWNNRFEIRPFALLPTNWRFIIIILLTGDVYAIEKLRNLEKHSYFSFC